MRRYFSGLRARLLLLVLLAAVPVFAANVYNAVSDRQQAADNATRDARNLVQLAAREQRRLIASTRQLLVSLSKLPEVRPPLSAQQCQHTLVDVLKPFPYYRNIGVALVNGDVVCRTFPTNKKVNIADRGYFIRAVESRDFGVGDYQIGRATGQNSVNFGQAILGNQGRVQAVVYTALDLDWLNQLIAANELPLDSTMTVIDNNGTIIARYPDSKTWVGKTLPNAPLFQIILAQQKEGTAELKGLDGTERIYAFAPLHNSPGGNAYVSVGLSKKVVFASANEDFLRNIVVLLVVSVLAMISAWIIGDTFVLRRITALVTAAKRLGEGDLTARSGLLHGETEEIGQLASSFDKMAYGLQLMNTALQRVNRVLKTLSACNREIVGADNESKLMHDLCRIIVKTGSYRYAWIGYAEHLPSKTVRAVAQFGQDGEFDELPIALIDTTWADTEQGGGLIGTAIRAIQPVVSHNFSTTFTSDWAETAARRGIMSAAAFPLMLQGKAIGALMICAAEADSFNAEERELLGEAAQDIAVGISMLRTRVEHNQILEHMAYFDEVTGLPNRAQLERDLRRATSEAGRREESLALAIVDINRLWEINDALGFHRGDQLLKEVGARIRGLFGDETVVARMRGDEFAVVLPNTDHAKAKQAVQNILNELREPLSIDGVTLEIGAVIGVSLYPLHGKHAVELIRHADVAMHQAKKSHQGFTFYAAENDEDHAKRLSLVGELRRAIETDQLVLYYQPKIDMRDGGVCGMEALVRWKHPTRGLIPPDEFIVLAEQSGLINSLTDWVVRTALRQSAQWQSVGSIMPIAVNLSARTLRDVDFLDRMRGLFNEASADPSSLELELTEGAIMEDANVALDILKQLSEMGIRLFIDDFGTGYSSLGYLKKLPVDAVKIDKSFVMDMLADADSAKIVRSTISLAHDLDLKVVAEGVESQEIMERLASLGCDVAQGYHISRPLPAEEFNKNKMESIAKPNVVAHFRKSRN